MEPLLPSEIDRLIYGYLKKEKNEYTAECFLKTSPHLIECYQMFKANRNFNIKVYGFNLHDIFDIFGTMCSMINERIPKTCESKTLIEKLQYLLDVNHKQANEDKCIQTELCLIMVETCDDYLANTEYKSSHTTIKLEENKTTEVLEIPSFSEIIPSNVSKTTEIDIINETTKTIENNSRSSPCLSSTSRVLINNNGNILNSSEIVKKDSSVFQMINDQISEYSNSTPSIKVEKIITSIEPIQRFIPIDNDKQFFANIIKEECDTNILKTEPVCDFSCHNNNPEIIVIPNLPGLKNIQDESIDKLAPEVDLTSQIPEKHIFPKRNRRSLLEVCGVKNNFIKSSIRLPKSIPIQSSQSSIIGPPEHNFQHWDTDIRNMVGIEISTSNADERRTREKNISRRKTKQASDKNNDRKIKHLLEQPERFSTTLRKSQNAGAEDIVKKVTKRPIDQANHKISPKEVKVKHQQLLKNVDVDEFLCVVHDQK